MNYPPKIGQPRFLSLDEVLTLHTASLDAYGGTAGILDQGKLDASLAMPRQGFGSEYAHEFPFGMAAAYGYHLAMNHAFRDGNKRTAFAAMVVFLRVNGWNFKLPDSDAAELILELIVSHRDKQWLAGRLREVSQFRVSFELRDFFASLNHRLLYSKSAEMNLDDVAGTRATRDEAILAIPAIREGIGIARLQHQKNDQDGLVRTMARLQLLAVLFRLAEDMGYEW